MFNYLEKEGHEYKVFAPEDEKEYNYNDVKLFKSVKFLLYPVRHNDSKDMAFKIYTLVENENNTYYIKSA